MVNVSIVDINESGGAITATAQVTADDRSTDGSVFEVDPAP